MASRKKHNPVWIPNEVEGVHPSLRAAADEVFDYLIRRPGPQYNDPSLTAKIIEDSVQAAARSASRRPVFGIRNWVSYLLTICIRRLLRETTRERKRIYIQSFDSLPGDRREWEHIDLQPQIEQILQLMDEPTRAIAELRLQRRSWAEIGALLNYKGPDAARKHFKAGLARLRKRITGDFSERKRNS